MSTLTASPLPSTPSIDKSATQTQHTTKKKGEKKLTSGLSTASALTQSRMLARQNTVPDVTKDSSGYTWEIYGAEIDPDSLREGSGAVVCNYWDMFPSLSPFEKPQFMSL